MIDCSAPSHLLKKNDFSHSSHLSEGYFVCLVRESNKEQWYTNGRGYFLRSLNVSAERCR